MPVCDKDCFNCKYDDCVLGTGSPGRHKLSETEKVVSEAMKDYALHVHTAILIVNGQFAEESSRTLKEITSALQAANEKAKSCTQSVQEILASMAKRGVK